jgi:hypothetical protein
MIAIIRTRPSFARVEYEPYHFLKWLELFPDNKFLWLSKNPDKVRKRFGEENFPAVESFDLDEYFKIESISERESYLDNLIESKNLTQIITIHNDIKQNFKNSAEEKGTNFFNGIIESDKLTSFVSVRNFFEVNHIPYYLSKKIPVVHVYVDPQEASWNKMTGCAEEKYFFYENSRIDAKYLPFVEWSFSKQIKKYPKKKKFAFGFTVVTEDREPLYYKLPEIENVNFLVKFPKIGIDTTVKRADYAEMLKESEFTLVIPSYEDTDFSSIRFWDAITKACVPFILESCNWKQAFLKHPEITQIIEEDLLVSAETVKDKIENACYEKLLNKIWNSKDWKNIQNLEWYKEEIRAIKFKDTEKPSVKKSSALF